MTRPPSPMRLSLALLMGFGFLVAATPGPAAATLPSSATSATPLAGLEARIDRSTIGLGESVQLLLRYRGSRPSTPDLSLLEDDFEILDAGQSSRTSIVNGVQDRSFDWRITLAPRREGTLSIPAFRMGGESSGPLELTVVAAGAGGATAAGMRSDAPVRVDVEVDNAEPYVQGEVTVTARITLDESVREGALADPALAGAIVERLGEDTSFRTEVDGKPYTVVERRYAVFPQASGEVVIPPLVFEGTQRAAAGGRRSAARDPFDDFFGSDPFGSSSFGSSMMGSLFQRGQRIRAQSDPVRLHVQPRPDSTAGAWFLPAQHVELFEEWSPEPPVFRSGEQVVRTLGISAVGLSGDQLPDLSLPELDGAKQYPGVGADRTFTDDGETVAVRVVDVAMLPTRAGELTLPALELEWWDTGSDTARTARLPERTVQVLPAAGTLADARSQAHAPDDAPTTAAPGADQAVGDDSPPSGGVGWQAWLPLLTVTALCGLAIGIGALRSSRRRAPADDDDDLRGPRPVDVQVGPSERSLREACRAGDAAAAARALVQAGRARHPALDIHNLGDLAAALSHGALTRAIDELSSAAYAPEGSAWNGASLWTAWTRFKRRTPGPAHGPVDALPELYPSS